MSYIVAAASLLKVLLKRVFIKRVTLARASYFNCRQLSVIFHISVIVDENCCPLTSILISYSIYDINMISCVNHFISNIYYYYYYKSYTYIFPFTIIIFYH